MIISLVTISIHKFLAVQDLTNLQLFSSEQCLKVSCSCFYFLCSLSKFIEVSGSSFCKFARDTYFMSCFEILIDFNWVGPQREGSKGRPEDETRHCFRSRDVLILDTDKWWWIILRMQRRPIYKNKNVWRNRGTWNTNFKSLRSKHRIR